MEGMSRCSEGPSSEQGVPALAEARCIFEHVYFSRPDSVECGGTMYGMRFSMGRNLAREAPVETDLVIGVPDSGLDAALGFSRESGIPYGIGLIKNKYIGRTFIAPDGRQDKVRVKLSAIREAVAGKRLVLIDDSIVRGTTSGRIVALLREAGALEKLGELVGGCGHCDACFSGRYPTRIPDDVPKDRFERRLSEVG